MIWLLVVNVVEFEFGLSGFTYKLEQTFYLLFSLFAVKTAASLEDFRLFAFIEIGERVLCVSNDGRALADEKRRRLQVGSTLRMGKLGIHFPGISSICSLQKCADCLGIMLVFP
jgi:hypothetical protein